MKNELITVIINVYNGEKFINKCIDSVINQTYKNLEIIIVNDGSTDKTLSIIKKYKDKRIKIITTKNQGLSLSRNTGIDNAKGEYLYFVDADDFIEPDTIEYLYNLSKKYNSSLTTCKSLTIFDYDYEIKNDIEKVVVLDSKNYLKMILMNEENAATFWNKLIKKDIFNNLRFQDKIINDLRITYKLAIKSSRIVYSNQIKYLYLKHKDAITVNKKGERIERIEDHYNAVIERYENIKKVYPNLIENEIGLLRGMLQLYALNNNEILAFLKEKKVEKLFKDKFSIKMLITKIRFKEKVKLIIFRISPKLFIKVSKFYRNKYKF